MTRPIARIAAVVIALALPLAPIAAQSGTDARPGDRVTVRAEGAPARASLGFGFSIPTRLKGTASAPQFETYDFPTVFDLRADSPAARAGLRDGDRIVAVNGRDGRDGKLFPEREPGTRYVIRVRRGLEEREIAFTLVARTPTPR